MAFYFYSLVIAVYLSMSISAQYNPGTYEGMVNGQDFNELSGIVSINVILSASHIDTITVTKFNQDIYHRVYGPPALDAKRSIPAIVLSRQSVDVDVVSGATLSSNSLLLSIARAIEKGVAGNFSDGKYSGSAQGRKDDGHSGIINVSLEISNNSITGIQIDTMDQITDHKRWGYYVKKAIKEIPDSVISRQSVEIDAVSQATNTSNALLLAIAKALEKAIKNDFN